MKLIIFLLASLFIFTGLIGFINSPNDLNINIKHNPYPVNVNNSVSYIREFPINLNNVPSGTGYYQQLITIGNASYPYSNYNINSQGSNIQFISQNNSYLYAWLQNINTTTITIWIKNFNSSNTINMQVFPEFENLFSANGYLGDNTTNNAKYVFPVYNQNTTINGHGFISAFYVGGTNNSYITNYIEYPSVLYYQWGISISYSGSGLYVYQTPSDYYVKGSTFTNIPFNTTNIYASWGTANTTDIIGMNWEINGNYGEQIGNISKQGNLEYVNGYAGGYANSGGIRTYYWIYGLNIPNGIMPLFTIGTGYYFLNITSIYINTNTTISNNYFWNGHITNIECYVLPELNNQPIIPLNYSGYITNSGLIYLNSSQFVNYHYNITFKYYSTVSPINYTFNEFYMPIFELGMIFLIGSVVYIEIRGYYRSIKER